MTPPLEATPLGDVVMLKMKEGIRRSRSTTSVRSWAAKAQSDPRLSDDQLSTLASLADAKHRSIVEKGGT